MSGGSQREPIAESVAGLADLPVGPGLGAALAPLNLSTLTDSQCIDLIQAWYRQNNHVRAQLFAVLAEVMHRGQADTSIRTQQWPGEFAADEVRAALVLTRDAAQTLCQLAQDVVRRLPAVQEAFAAGVLDQPRVRVFSDWTSDLSKAHTTAIVSALLPRAAQLTTAQLIAEIQRHAIALDPGWARRRYERALKSRRVVGTRNSDGTANLSGYDLPVEQVAAACDRLGRLAKAAKQAGHPDRIDHLRAGLFLGMTDGSYQGLTDPQILDHLLANTNHTPPPPATGPTNPPDADHSPAADASGEDPSGDEAPADDAVDADRPGGDQSARDSAETPPGEGAGGVESSDPPSTQDGLAKDSRSDEPPAPTAAGGAGESHTSGLRLLVRVATLAGADQRPGELLGWGPVHAE